MGRSVRTTRVATLLLIGRRVAFVPIALWLVVTLTFALVSLLPGDPARVIAGPAASPEQLQSIRDQLGLNLPTAERYAEYIQGVLRLDLGKSFYSGRPIADDLFSRLPASIELIIPAVLTASIIGLLVGIVSARSIGRWQDHVGRFYTSIAQSLPDFFLGLMLIYVAFFLLGWAPAPSGRLGFEDTPPPTTTGFLLIDSAMAGQWNTFRSAVSRMALPVLTLGVVYSAFFAKTARAVIGKALQSRQVEYARALGLPEWQVTRYALLEARTPLLTYGAILLASLLGGAAIVEKVFAWPGTGSWALDAILQLDVPAIQGFTLVVGAATLLIFLSLDITVMILDPRIRYDA